MAAITAAAAAAVGLVFSAWTTYISQEVARDQLAHSKDQDEESERSQAASANAWVERRWNIGVSVLVVANRSPDPLKDVIVGIVAEGSAAGGRKYLKVAIVSVADSIPPCSKAELRLDDVYATDGKENIRIEQAIASDYFLAFRDSNARKWERDKYGSLRRIVTNGETPEQSKYLSLGRSVEYDGPHQANIDQELNTYEHLDCNDKPS